MIGILSAALGAGAQIVSANRAASAQRAAVDDARADQRRGARQAVNALNLGEQNALGYLSDGFGSSAPIIRNHRDSAIGALKLGRDQQIDQARKTYLTQADLYRGTRQGGMMADAVRDYELGYGDKPAGYSGFQGTPGYQFRVNEMQDALEGSAAASGNLFSGATLEALQNQRNGLADQSWNGFMGLLGQRGMEGQQAAARIGAAASERSGAIRGAWQSGQGAIANTRMASGNALANLYGTNGANMANIAQNTGTNAANIYGAQGRDLASLSIGAGNVAASGAIAAGTAINQGIGNGLGAYMWQQQMQNGGM